MLSYGIAMPLEDPVLKFLVILLIILFVPILSDKLKVPHLLGMIIAGLIIGPHGLNLLARDSGIILSGTAGLLYIMFLAGLELDMKEFRTHALKSTLLGLYGFAIPMIIGTLAGIYLLHFRVLTSVLLASMFASHTLISYPIVSKLGIVKNLAVTVAIGSTLITNTLALLVLAIVVGLAMGEMDHLFWLRLLSSLIGFTLIIVFIYPLIARWFFKRFHDSVSQYIFVLAMVFLGAVLSQIAGIEGIIGAFMAGLALNRFIPSTSSLMNRINFVGNAIFIPFFLIGVGMLVDFRAFINPDSLYVAAAMTLLATLGKYLAARLAQFNFRFRKEEGLLIFGLTNAQAAATLAAVLVGYNIIIGQTTDGQNIRLLDDSVLNGTIIMILITCTVATFVTQKNAMKIVLNEQSPEEILSNDEKILIPISNPDTIEELVLLSTMMKSRGSNVALHALNIVQNEGGELAHKEKMGQKILVKARTIAAGADIDLKTSLRYDLDLVHGVTNVILEENITDLVLGLHFKEGASDSFLGSLTSGLLSKSSIPIYIYNACQPLATLRQHVLIIPENAEYESGFSFWLAKIWNIGMNSGSRIVMYGFESTINFMIKVNGVHPIDLVTHTISNLDHLGELLKLVGRDDNLVMVLSRQNQLSYHPVMQELPNYLNRHFTGRNFLLIYPAQAVPETKALAELSNASLLAAIERIDVVGKTLAGLFRKH